MQENLKDLRKAFADEANAAAEEQARYQALALQREAYGVGKGPMLDHGEVRLWCESMRSYLERSRASLNLVRVAGRDLWITNRAQGHNGLLDQASGG